MLSITEDKAEGPVAKDPFKSGFPPAEEPFDSFLYFVPAYTINCARRCSMPVFEVKYAFKCPVSDCLQSTAHQITITAP